MLSVVGFFITIQPNLFLIALSIALISAIFVALLLKDYGLGRRWKWAIMLACFALVYAFEHIALDHFYGIGLTKIEMVQSLSHPKN